MHDDSKNSDMFPYDEVEPFWLGFAKVRRGDQWGVINNKGEEISPCRYDEIKRYWNGFAKVRKGTYNI